MTINTRPLFWGFKNFVFAQVSDLQRSLKASQAKEHEALERTAAAVTQEQKAIQDSLLQVCRHIHNEYDSEYIVSN